MVIVVVVVVVENVFDDFGSPAENSIGNLIGNSATDRRPAINPSPAADLTALYIVTVCIIVGKCNAIVLTASLILASRKSLLCGRSL